jgi:hypothetical protein
MPLQSLHQNFIDPSFDEQSKRNSCMEQSTVELVKIITSRLSRDYIKTSSSIESVESDLLEFSAD